MSQETQPDDVPPAEGITDFGQLYVRRLYGHTYRVLSLTDEDPTTYKVDLRELTCTCPDYSHRQDLPNICKHLAKTLYQAPADPSLEREVFDSLTEVHSEAVSIVEDLRDVRDVSQAVRNSEADAAAAEAQEPAEEPDSTGPRTTSLDEVEDWLQTGFAQPDLVDIREGSHDGVEGVVLEPDNQAMPDHVYESFKGIVNSLEDSNVHVGFGDDPCHACGKDDGEFWYFVPFDDSSEVWG